MNTIWIGDFRGTQLQQLYNKTNKATTSSNSDNTADAAEYIYITDDSAEYTWFKNSALAQLPLMALDKTNVIIMLGLNDCIYSCVWEAFNIDKIAKNYILTINELVAQYPDNTFYMCSVNPVEADYPFAEHKEGIILKDSLNKKIKQFNNTIKKNCTKITYIDSYSYFTGTSFNTRDGVRFTPDTCAALQEYITGQFKVSYSVTFIPRTEAPSERNACYYSNENPFYAAGYGMPNCTAYAWGRFYEILGSIPKLSTADAGQWFGNTSDGYKRSQNPQEGAVICWSNPGEAGHVAIVEKIIDDKTIKISESAWGGFIDGDDWKYSTITKSGNSWNYSGSFVFQGFIYNPKVTSGGAVGDYVSKSEVISKNAFISEAEMRINARYIWQYLGAKGWTLNAVAGMLGNMESESNINPGIWQNLREGGPTAGHGYSLVQWTPYTNYTNWCKDRGLNPADMDSALKRIEWECETNTQFYKTSAYPVTFKEFTKSTKDAYWLGGAFLTNYERPAYFDYEGRGKQAEKWYKFLLPYAPGAGTEGKPTLSLNNFKIDKLLPTSVKASFITRGGATGYFKLLDSSNKQLEKRNVTVSSTDGALKVISFECKNLIPTKTYKLYVEVTGDSSADKVKASITFTTPQAFPETVSKIKLITKDSKLPNDAFLLETTPITNWGYWKKNNHGYDIQLIINGKCKSEKTENSLNRSLNFTLSKFFKYSKISVGDSIQIGIRTWVKDDKGKKIFDNDFAKTSNAICMLTQPFKVYLNAD